MIFEIPSDFCAKHKRTKWVLAATNPPIRVCPKCPGGKQYIEVYGTTDKPTKRKRYLVTIVNTIEAVSEVDAMYKAKSTWAALDKGPFIHVKEKFGKERAWESAAGGSWKEKKVQMCFSCGVLPQKYDDGLCERCNAVACHESKRMKRR